MGCNVFSRIICRTSYSNVVFTHSICLDGMSRELLLKNGHNFFFLAIFLLLYVIFYIYPLVIPEANITQLCPKMTFLPYVLGDMVSPCVMGIPSNAFIALQFAII